MLRHHPMCRTGTRSRSLFQLAVGALRTRLQRSEEVLYQEDHGGEICQAQAEEKPVEGEGEEEHCHHHRRGSSPHLF